MFPVFSTKAIIFIISFILGLIFMFGVAFALILNCIFKTPLNRYLVSSGIIAVMSYVASAVILIYALPPLNWVNGVPQDWRTTLWDNSGIISAAVSLICFVGWQVAVRMRRLRQPDKHAFDTMR